MLVVSLGVHINLSHSRVHFFATEVPGAIQALAATSSASSGSAGIPSL